MSRPRVSKEKTAARVAYVAGQLSLLLSDAEIIAATSAKFDCSPRVAARYLDQARKRSLFSDRSKRAFQDSAAHAYAGLFRASLSRKGSVECPECKAKVQVAKPSIGTAGNMLRGLVDLWKLQATPEDMLSSDELRAATVQAMLGQADCFTTEELVAMAAEFSAIVERRKPAQMPLDLG